MSNFDHHAATLHRGLDVTDRGDRDGDKRNRAGETSERTRAERRARGVCIDCDQPSDGRQRCRRCSARVEGNTARYRGQGRRGPPERIAVDLKDLGHAIEALDGARRGFADVNGIGETNARRRRELLIEPRSKADLALRLIGGVLERNPAPVTPVDEPTPLERTGPAPVGYHARKAAGWCVRAGCSCAPGEDSLYCDPHRDDQLARKRKSNARVRAARRGKQRCADCGRRSKCYRCAHCRGGDTHGDNSQANHRTEVVPPLPTAAVAPTSGPRWRRS